jgi:hypothetical protein
MVMIVLLLVSLLGWLVVSYGNEREFVPATTDNITSENIAELYMDALPFDETAHVLTTTF